MEIEELFESDITFTDAKDKKLFLANLMVPLSKADTPNKNKRIYSSALLKREMDRMNAKVQHGPVPGMLRHNPQGVIALDKVSHVFTEFSYNKEEGIAYGKARILNTTHGKNLYTLIQSGVKCGASTVGTGNTDEAGNVQNNYEMKSADIVHAPSAGLLLGPSLLESLNTVLEKDTALQKGLLAEELRLAGGPGRSIE